MLLAGDFNCVLQAQDCTGVPHMSLALQTLITGMDLVDTWPHSHGSRQYTHYTTTGASRIDRIYVSRNMLARQPSTEIRAAAFTDHMTVILHTTCAVTAAHRGRGLWRMNAALLHHATTRNLLAEEWLRWKATRHNYITSVQWWCR
jgi:hypothetical protein